MSFMSDPLRCDAATEIGEHARLFDIRLTLSLQDQRKIWDAAAIRLNAAGIEEEDMEDCIGPRTDISFVNCLYTLLLPLAVPGCALADIIIQEAVPDFSILLQAVTQL